MIIARTGRKLEDESRTDRGSGVRRGVHRIVLTTRGPDGGDLPPALSPSPSATRSRRQRHLPRRSEHPHGGKGRLTGENSAPMPATLAPDGSGRPLREAPRLWETATPPRSKCALSPFRTRSFHALCGEKLDERERVRPTKVVLRQLRAGCRSLGEKDVSRVLIALRASGA